MNVFKLRREKGFTLVELLVVIAIIGVLATLVLLQLGTARARARDTKRISDVSQLRTAVEQYFEDNGGKYPADISQLTLQRYVTKVPTDPLSAAAYGYAIYKVGGNITAYQIYTTLEQSATALNGAPHIDSSGAGWTGGVNATTASTVTCSSAPGTSPACVYDQGIKP